MPRTVHGFETGDMPMTALIDEIRFQPAAKGGTPVQRFVIEDRRGWTARLRHLTGHGGW